MRLNGVFSIIISIYSLLASHAVSSQRLADRPGKEPMEVYDSLVNSLTAFPKNDTARLSALVRMNYYISTYALVDIPYEKRTGFLEEHKILSQKLSSEIGTGTYYADIATAIKRKQQYSQSLLYFDSAVYFLRGVAGEEAKWRLADVYAKKSAIYRTLEDFDMAVVEQLKSLEYFQQKKDKDWPMRLSAMSELYLLSGNNMEKALAYGKESVEAAETIGDKLTLLNVLTVSVKSLIASKEYQNAILYLKKFEPVDSLTSFYFQISYYKLYGTIDNDMGNLTEAENKFTKAYKICQAKEHIFMAGDILNSLLEISYAQKEYRKAKKYADEYLIVSEKYKSKRGKLNALKGLVYFYQHTGNINTAFEYQSGYLQLYDSVLAEENAKRIQHLEIKFQSEKKQKEILQLTAEKKQKDEALKKKNKAITYMLVAFWVLTIITGLLYNNYLKKRKIAKQQEELQQQKIAELEKDKKLLVADAMIKTQEEERSRFAKDLHDGVGGLLSGIKYSLSGMKENVILTGENASVFERSIGMIDESIKELRRVAHNMMPETLARYGLENALKDFCDAVSNSATSIRFQSFGDERKLATTHEIIIYRIIQELVNNALRHAHASSVMAQIVKGDDWVTITVEDNGSGFEPGILKTAKGAGWSNIVSRVEYLKGHIDIKPEKGKGASITIELKV